MSLDSINSAFEKEKIQFAANMTHELLSPITGIKITAELIIKNHVANAEEQRLLQNIVNTSSKLSEAINLILKMSKEISQEASITTFSLQQLVNDVIETVRLSAEAKNLALHIGTSPDITVTADRFRCFRILLNLLENAIKYTPQGHIVVGYKKQKNGTIQLYVSDTGIGISKERQKEIFNCYTQLESGLLDTDGVGLGLHLVLLFSQQMGGKIKVKSQPNEGSTFSFSFKSQMKPQ